MNRNPVYSTLYLRPRVRPSQYHYLHSGQPIHRSNTRSHQFCFVGANFRQEPDGTLVRAANVLLHFFALKKKIGDFGQALKNKRERNRVIGFGKIESAEIFGNNRFGEKLFRKQQNFIKMKLAKFVPVSVKLGLILGKIGPFFHHILGEKTALFGLHLHFSVKFC